MSCGHLCASRHPPKGACGWGLTPTQDVRGIKGINPEFCGAGVEVGNGRVLLGANGSKTTQEEQTPKDIPAGAADKTLSSQCRRPRFNP